MVNNADFTKRLQKILEFYSLSAAAFAETIDFNRSTISHLLSGRNKPSLEFVMKLYQKFPEVNIDWLLFGKGNFPSTLSSTSTNSEIKTQKENTVTFEQKPKDLFSEEILADTQQTIQTGKNSKQIERIVIFYSDGTFNDYKN